MIKLVILLFIVLWFFSSDVEARWMENTATGGAKSNAHLRIVGGRFAKPDEVPHQIGLIVKDELSTGLGCGGSLIADRWVLTAAHCLETMRPKGYRVVLGTNLWDAPVTRVGVDSVHRHPEYSQDFLNDIAMIKLSIPFSSLKTNARVINLPRELEENNFQVAIVSGFGITKENGTELSSWLKVANVIIRSTRQCATRYGRQFFPRYQICAGLMRGTNDTCQGDSGGPLFTRRSDGSSVILGITSWGYGCGRRLTPGIYTRVSRYLSWIKKIMHDN